MLLHTTRPSIETDINQMSHGYNISTDVGHMAARNMYRIEISVHDKIVRHVGYLQGSYQAARSTEHKISTM